jgi:hypothetical protein
MNDFTLEELKETLYCVTHYQSCKWSSPQLVQLESKLISMIDNYNCKHVDNGMHYYTNPPKYCCKKYGEFYI